MSKVFNRKCYVCKKGKRIPCRPYCYECYFEKTQSWSRPLKKRLDYKITKKRGERWKDIPGFIGYYQVSNLGRSKSLKRTVRLSNGKLTHIKEKLMNPVDQSGYLAVVLYRNGKKKRMPVHRTAMLAFVGPSKKVVDHINGNKKDNRLKNLRYCTHRENLNFFHSSIRTSSQYLGVSWSKGLKKWNAKIRINNKSYHLGYFAEERDASQAYIGASKIAKYYEKLA